MDLDEIVKWTHFVNQERIRFFKDLAQTIAGLFKK